MFGLELNREAISRETVVEKQQVHKSNSVLIQFEQSCKLRCFCVHVWGLRFSEIHSHLSVGWGFSALFCDQL